MDKANRVGRRRDMRGFVGRNVIDNCVEAVARMSDAAERVMEDVTEVDPRYGARTAGDVVRDSPNAVGRLVYAFNDGLRDVNDSLSDMMDLRRWDRRRETVRPASYARTDEQERPAEDEVVAESRAYLGRGRYRGATLDGLIRHLRVFSGLSELELEAIVGRHFLIDGGLVLPAEDGGADLPDSVEEHLRALGYTDLRRKVALARVDDAPAADLVAYVAGKPAIIVMRVAPGRMNDPQTLEDGRFQAMALDGSTTPSHLYLTDGRVNRYYSVVDDRMVTELPRQPAAA